MSQDRIGQNLLLLIITLFTVGSGSILIDCIFNRKR